MWVNELSSSTALITSDCGANQGAYYVRAGAERGKFFVTMEGGGWCTMAAPTASYSCSTTSAPPPHTPHHTHHKHTHTQLPAAPPQWPRLFSPPIAHGARVVAHKGAAVSAQRPVLQSVAWHPR